MTLVEPQPVTSRESSSVNIRQMTEADLESVIRIHCESFPDSRSTELGKPFLKKMYRWFMHNYPELSLVASDGQHLFGFLAGSFGGYSKRLFRYAIFEICLSFIRRPSLLFRQRMSKMWWGYLKGLFERHASVSNTQEAKLIASLGSIAVGSAGRGKSVSDALMHAFEHAAHKRNAAELFLTVRAENTNARRLYERCGWELISEDKASSVASYGKNLRVKVVNEVQRKADLESQ